MGMSVAQVLGAVMVGVGVWLELEEREFVAAVESRTFLIGPYLIVAAGCAIIVVAGVGFAGALCDHKVNRILLYLVSRTGHAHNTPLIFCRCAAVHCAGADRVCYPVGGRNRGICVQGPADWHSDRWSDSHSQSVQWTDLLQHGCN